MNTHKVVITGAPGTGKTSIINGLEKKGFICYHEIIRDMTLKAKKDGESNAFVSNPLMFVDDALQFNTDLLHGRREHFKKSLGVNTSICFFDRGVPDVLAYMDFFNQPYPQDFVEVCENHKYDSIFVVPPWKEIYVSDNERLETFAEAEKIHHALINTYSKFGYNPIIVPKNPVDVRIAFVLETLKQV